MSGDTLSVFLFFAGIAVSCGIAAMTVEGFRRHTLTGMGIGSGLLAVATAIWGLRLFGSAAGALLENAESPVSWFVLLMFLVGLMAWTGRTQAPALAQPAQAVELKPAVSQTSDKRAALVASFTEKSDVENKVFAIDAIRKFRTDRVLPAAQRLNAVRNFISRNRSLEESDIKDVQEISRAVHDLYVELGKFREQYKHYPALADLLSNPPGKGDLYRYVDLLGWALKGGQAPIVDYHQNLVWGWLEDWGAWWGRVDDSLIEMRTKIVGG